MNQATLLFFLVIISLAFALENNEIENDGLVTEQKHSLPPPRHFNNSILIPCQPANNKTACWSKIYKKYDDRYNHTHYFINQTVAVCWNTTKTYDVTPQNKSTPSVTRKTTLIVPTCSKTVVAVPINRRVIKAISKAIRKSKSISKSISKSKSKARSKSRSKAISRSRANASRYKASASTSISAEPAKPSIMNTNAATIAVVPVPISASQTEIGHISDTNTVVASETKADDSSVVETAEADAESDTDAQTDSDTETESDTDVDADTDADEDTESDDNTDTDQDAEITPVNATATDTAIATATSNDVRISPTDNSDIYANSDAAADNDISNKALGIGLGVGIGCIAALGLAGLVVFNRRKKQQQLEDDAQSVPTRWRPQSFMGVVATVVSKLPRSPSQRSKASTDMLGVAIGHGQGAVETSPSANSRQY
ncbi:hypothetical protein BD408DRAFT_414492 [Parasitella parasitica]|nr:hypothetical protein BD408DRAFT_414492 [Parasitella parasitica]